MEKFIVITYIFFRVPFMMQENFFYRPFPLLSRIPLSLSLSSLGPVCVCEKIYEQLTNSTFYKFYTFLLILQTLWKGDGAIYGSSAR